MLEDFLISRPIIIPKTQAGQQGSTYQCEVFHETLTNFGSMAILKMHKSLFENNFILVIHIKEKGYVFHDFTESQFESAQHLFNLLKSIN